MAWLISRSFIAVRYSSSNLNAADSSTVLTSTTVSPLIEDQPSDGSSDSTDAATPALRSERESNEKG